MDVTNWDDEPVDALSDTIGRQMLNTAALTIARIHLRAGAIVPRHQHENEQVSTVLEGRLRFLVGDEEAEISAGQSVAIRPNVPHEVHALTDALALDVFTPRREDWISGDDQYLRR
jgi:quercetin dioxygenase-like cupin family protein